MKKLVIGFVVALSMVSAPVFAEAPQGELDPGLEFRVKNHKKPTAADCIALAWTRGVHNEVAAPTGDGRSELDIWMPECMAGRIPFTEDNEHFRLHRQKYLNEKNRR